MKEMWDPNFLCKQQYANADRLSARMRLQTQYGTNPYPWWRWIFDHLALSPQSLVLELGCGPAALWTENKDRIQPGWKVTLSDFSEGMLAEARKAVLGLPQVFTFAVIDAQKIPLPDDSFDCVIANNMLYHVPNVDKALSEIARVLKPSGRFHAATSGANHMRELFALLARVVPGFHNPIERFTLENGSQLLRRHFASVALDRYDDKLVVPEAEPVYDYVRSMGSLGTLDDAQLSDLRRRLDAWLNRDGRIVITKDFGIFTAVAEGDVKGA